jgi:hypothetical protein
MYNRVTHFTDYYLDALASMAYSKHKQVCVFNTEIDDSILNKIIGEKKYPKDFKAVKIKLRKKFMDDILC